MAGQYPGAQAIAVVAEFETGLLIERSNSGIARAKATGAHFGRALALSAA
jgi:putative DNA-invertase from lambdoid prophage Rac